MRKPRRLAACTALTAFLAMDGCRPAQKKNADAENAPGDDAPLTIPDSSTWAEKQLPTLRMSLRVAPGATFVHLKEKDDLFGPNFFVRHASGTEVLWLVPKLYTPTREDPVGAQIGYATTGAKKSARVLLRDANTFIVRFSEGVAGDHCEVTACSTTKLKFCVEAGIFKKNQECAETAAMMRSLRDVP